MNQGEPMAEDSFEKARKSFFGTASETPQPATPPVEITVLTADPPDTLSMESDLELTVTATAARA